MATGAKENLEIKDMPYANGEADAIQAPIVFQCNTCLSILGDTISLVCTLQDLQLYCIGSKNVKIHFVCELIHFSQKETL